ncbi:hypothetical protein [Pseudonocardia sp. WMMC193]|uniref:hypothetical protein n=1 Tax=Pseudonocardia sp. WMMC193 TaxID=2911965 RepID=UPI001F1A7534|nr:hypothetical protein [Pseudonocardia sp. WMMC193]MCF7552164.1 hypothetical protein [Pseudonocardia sp. WMMC193]
MMAPTGVGHRLMSLAFEIAAREFDGEIVVELIPGYQMLTRQRLVDPLPGVRATRALVSAARGLLVEQVRDARAAGRSWEEIGEALGFAGSPTDEPRAEAAFAEVVEGRRVEPTWHSSRTPSTYWRCRSCGELVTDYGPIGSSHPDDQESGHAATCTRHRAALARWRADTGWD